MLPNGQQAITLTNDEQFLRSQVVVAGPNKVMSGWICSLCLIKITMNRNVVLTDIPCIKYPV